MMSSAGHEAGREVQREPYELGLAELVRHIESTHHVFLREALPKIGDLLTEVVALHGEEQPHTRELNAVFETLRSELGPHLMKEEMVLFPLCQQLGDATELPTVHCGTVENPIRMMRQEHDLACDLLGRMESLTCGYAAPPGVGDAYRALLEQLVALDADLRMHIHKETDILFPMAITREKTLAGNTR